LIVTLLSHPSQLRALGSIAGLSPVHGLFACAGEDGLLECFDLRAKNPVGFVDAAANCGAPGMTLDLNFAMSSGHMVLNPRGHSPFNRLQACNMDHR
jgi:hypothetical protein